LGLGRGGGDIGRLLAVFPRRNDVTERAAKGWKLAYSPLGIAVPLRETKSMEGGEWGGPRKIKLQETVLPTWESKVKPHVMDDAVGQTHIEKGKETSGSRSARKNGSS